MYNPNIGRWNGVDALADAKPGWTPFRYGFNNPITFFDPDGNFELKKRDKQTYKHTDRVLKRIGEKMNTAPRLVPIFSKHSGLSDERTREYLTYGEGSPIINIVKMADSAIDGYTEEDGSIYISLQNVTKLEKWGDKVEIFSAEIEALKESGGSEKAIAKREKKLNKAKDKFNASATKVEATVLHEGVHKGDKEANNGSTDDSELRNQREGVQGKTSYERGDDFEKEYYGRKK